MIRPAARSDLAEVMNLVQMYYAKMEFEARSGIGCVPEAVEVLARSFMLSPNGCVLVDDDGTGYIQGVVAGTVMEWPTDSSQRAAQEFICFGRDAAALRSAFDAWARSRGASVAMISCFITTDAERMRRI